MLFRRSGARRDEVPEAAPTAEAHIQTNTSAGSEQAGNRERQPDVSSKVYGPLANDHLNPLPAPSEETLAGLRVLLAEDHDVNADLMIEELTHLGAQVRHAIDGEIACQLFMIDTFDVILMDCQMPNVDGFEAARRIRACEAQQGRSPIPIVAMTGLSREFEHAHSSQVGMDHYLVKPFHSKQLAWTILRATAASRAKQQLG